MQRLFLAGLFVLSSNFLFGIEQPVESLDLQIPVVDMRDYDNPLKREAFLDTLYDAMCRVGFFAVKSTGIDTQVVKRAYKEAQGFFKQDLEFKMHSFKEEVHGQRGFVPGESAKSQGSKDLKEFYHIGREGGCLENIWPEDSTFQEVFTRLYQELESYAIPLQEAILLTINQHAGSALPSDLLSSMTEGGESLFRALYYPAFTSQQMEVPAGSLYWGAPHTDIDFLTILPHATEKGLQVEVDGQWLNVVVPEDTFIVNIGDMLENLTNGLFVSAHHRVVALEPDKERFSMVLFIHPKIGTELKPLPECVQLTGGVQRYAPGTREEFLWERLLELGIAPSLLEPYSKTGHFERQMQYGRESPQVLNLLKKERLLSSEALEMLKDCH